MILYEYEHCPFCLRVRMVLAQTNTQCEIKTLLYDDSQTPMALIGKKQVPILVHADKVLAESEDIIRYLQASTPGFSIKAAAPPAEFSAKLRQLSSVAGKLYKPRIIKLPLPEFATPAAIEYFIKRHTPKLQCSFEQALANSAEYIAIAQPHLDWLADYLATRMNHVSGKNAPFIDGEFSWSDINLWPRLYNLSCVAGLSFADPLNLYIDAHCQRTGLLRYAPLS